MPYYDQVKTKYQTIADNKCNGMDTKSRVVGIPLKLFGMYFKNLFSYTLGFEWFLNLTRKFDMPGKKITLPTFTYVCDRYPNFEGFENYIREGDLPDPMISSFVMTKICYTVTPLNFLFVLPNYLSRNLGKLIGCVLASPFTVPAYLIIKTTYKIKDILLHNAYQKSLGQMDNSSLIDGWITELSLPMEDIAKRITIDTLWSSHTDRGARGRSLLTHKILKKYAHERNIFLESVKPWPITAAGRKIRVQIETEQELLASIRSSKDLGSIPGLMLGYGTVQNYATVLAANAQAHAKDPMFACSIDPLLSLIAEFAEIPLLQSGDLVKAQRLSRTLQVVDAKILAQSMSSQDGPLSNQGLNLKREENAELKHENASSPALV